VLKKVGIVAAAGTVAMLALSPLAFAGENSDHGDKTQRNQYTICNFNNQDKKEEAKDADLWSHVEGVIKLLHPKKEQKADNAPHDFCNTYGDQAAPKKDKSDD
jgi:hypothetical protein